MNMKNILYILTIAIFLSCSDDRITLLEENVEFESMDAFFNQHQPSDQEFIITGDTGQVITALGGTQLFVDSSVFVNSSGLDVSYPFSIKFLELYSYSDMILSQVDIGRSGTVSRNSPGLGRLLAFKNNDTLSVKFGKEYNVNFIDIGTTIASLQEYYGGKDSFNSWTSNGSSVNSIGSYFSFQGNTSGWINPSGAPSLIGVTSYLAVNLPNNDFQNTYVYVLINDYKGLVRYTGSMNMEGGLSVKVIAFGKISGQQGYSWFETDLIMNTGHYVNISFDTVTESELLSNINSL